MIPVHGRRFLAQRTGVDMAAHTPETLAQDMFKRTKEELHAMRAGAFFVVCDEYSKGSAVFKMLTQTNIAIPLEQFFEAGAGNPSLQDSAPPLIDAASAFVTEERMGAQYAQSRADFKGSVLSLGVLTSLGQAGVVLGANSAAISSALVACKSVLGNVQILSSLAREAHSALVRFSPAPWYLLEHGLGWWSERPLRVLASFWG